MKNLQTILGAGGAIGNGLAQVLKEYTDDIRLVSRNPQKINPTDELMPANLLNSAAVQKAIEGSSVVYLCVGFQYDIRVWRKNWPTVMQNVINACEEYNSKLVFFDNIYMYDKEAMVNITEESPINPPSKKGKIRAEIANLVLDQVNKGKLTALIARSADFYGPGVQNSMLTQTVITPLKQGKKANWLGNVDCKHSFTYVPDAVKATALLGNTDDAFNQVWHLPTAGEALTGRQWIEAIAAEMRVKAGYRSMPKFLVKIAGYFIPVLKEMPEMMYQYESDYIFKSDKFKEKFDLKPTSYADGIRELALAEEHLNPAQPT